MAWETAINRVNPKCKQLVQLRLCHRRREQALPKKVPIERFKMTYVEDDAMTLGNGPIVEKIRTNEGEDFIGTNAGIRQTFKEFMTQRNIDLLCEHTWPPRDNSVSTASRVRCSRRRKVSMFRIAPRDRSASPVARPPQIPRQLYRYDFNGVVSLTNSRRG